MFHLKWEYNPQPKRGVDPLLPARVIHILVQVVAVAVVVVAVGKLARGVVVAINGVVGEDQEPVPVRTRAGTRRVLVGILVVVHGVVRPHGMFESCKIVGSAYIRRLVPHLPSRSVRSHLLSTAVLSQKPTILCSFSPASSARDDRSSRSPFVISTFPQFTNSPTIRSLIQGWPTSPWVVSSSRYVLRHLSVPWLDS